MGIKSLLVRSILASVLMGMFLTACGSEAEPVSKEQQSAPTAASTGGKGEQLLNERCTVCHTLDRVKAAQKTQDEWSQTVGRMVGKGAKLSSDEQKILVEFLSATFGP